MRFIVITFFFLFLSAAGFSQTKEFETREQTWLGYFNQTRFTDKSGLWVDLHFRMNNNFVNETALTIARAGYIYYLTNNTRLSSGYAYITHYGLTTGAPNVPEHRPWQQIQWYEKKSWYMLMQYFRLEERFRRKVSDNELVSGYNFSYRIRYNISMTIPLKGKEVAPRVPFLFLNDEVHISFGKEVVNNYFDQNRLFAGVGYQFTPMLNAQLGYLYVFQQLPAGNRYINTNAVRFFVFHNLDFRKQNE